MRNIFKYHGDGDEFADGQGRDNSGGNHSRMREGAGGKEVENRKGR